MAKLQFLQGIPTASHGRLPKLSRDIEIIKGVARIVDIMADAQVVEAFKKFYSKNVANLLDSITFSISSNNFI